MGYDLGARGHNFGHSGRHTAASTWFTNRAGAASAGPLARQGGGSGDGGWHRSHRCSRRRPSSWVASCTDNELRAIDRLLTRVVPFPEKVKDEEVGAMRDKEEKVKDASDILKELTQLHAELASKRKEASRLIKEACLLKATHLDREAANKALTEVRTLGERHTALCDEGLMLAGLTEEDIAALDAADASLWSSGEVDVSRQNYTSQNVPSTGLVEDLLPKALDALLKELDPRWLKAEKANRYRLDASYLETPLSIVSGARMDSETLPIHRYAQALLVSADFLENREDYDFHAGALLVPQLARLGFYRELLGGMKGNVLRRIRSLSEGESSKVESTIYELLVAGACAQNGRDVEMLDPTQEKTPDIRLHDDIFPMPCVVEAKRRQNLTEYEKAEQANVQILFSAMAKELRSCGIIGIVEADIRQEIKEVPVSDFVEAVRHQSRYGLSGVWVEYGWGELRFIELEPVMDLRSCRVYSPNFLAAVFDWDVENPIYDGLVCQVQALDGLVVNRAKNPIALKWKSSSAKALTKKSRSVSSLLGDAVRQVPPGEIGVLYICLREGSPMDVADRRMERFMKEVRDWHHRWGISVPAFFINRIFPRPLNDGNPDLVENVINFKADFAHPKIFEDLPSCVFTDAPRP